MFGGLAAGESTTGSVGRAYLERATSKDVAALSDLWYLDLVAELTIDCVRGLAKCPALRWNIVDVPGCLHAPLHPVLVCACSCWHGARTG
jgi:hypothetical protein